MSGEVQLLFDATATAIGNLRICGSSKPGEQVLLGFRPECLTLADDALESNPNNFDGKLHTSTFLGNPLGCAMALASLEKHADPSVARMVCECGKKLRTALADAGQAAAGHQQGHAEDHGQ